MDYRDLKEKYDNIVSIEMIEAVGEKYLNQYFGTIKNSLNHNGTAAIQGIVIKEDLFKRYRGNEDFIQKYIFPGGFLPSLNFMKHLMIKNKLNFEKINTYSDDYAKTLDTWRKNFSMHGRQLKYKDLMIILRECGSFTSLIAKLDLSQKTLT